jgi:26S proteasome regulatory subunit T4
MRRVISSVAWQGRLDRKIEIPLPNEQARMDILKIHSAKMAKQGDIGPYSCRLLHVSSASRFMVIIVALFADFEAVCRLADGFNGADMRNVCTEAGMFAIRGDRDYVLEEDFMKAARKIAEGKKLESKLDYTKV